MAGGKIVLTNHFIDRWKERIRDIRGVLSKIRKSVLADAKLVELVGLRGNGLRGNGFRNNDEDVFVNEEANAIIVLKIKKFTAIAITVLNLEEAVNDNFR